MKNKKSKMKSKKLKKEKQKAKKNCKTKNEWGIPSYFVDGQIWQMELLNRHSVGLFYWYFHVLFIVLLKQQKLPYLIGLESPSQMQVLLLKLPCCQGQLAPFP